MLRTSRLLLRSWRDADRQPFAALNADPRVMEHFPKMLDRDESDQIVARIEEHFAQHGFGLWAVEVPGVAPFIGFVGLAVPAYEAHFTPCVEVGWRLAKEYWGHGYATEAAEVALACGFGDYGLDEIVSLTAVGNLRSQRVMQRLGMVTNEAENFDHPKLSPDSPLCRHVLYRLAKSDWKRRRGG